MPKPQLRAEQGWIFDNFLMLSDNEDVLHPGIMGARLERGFKMEDLQGGLLQGLRPPLVSQGLGQARRRAGEDGAVGGESRPQGHRADAVPPRRALLRPRPASDPDPQEPDERGVVPAASIATTTR